MRLVAQPSVSKFIDVCGWQHFPSLFVPLIRFLANFNGRIKISFLFESFPLFLDLRSTRSIMIEVRRYSYIDLYLVSIDSTSDYITRQLFFFVCVGFVKDWIIY